MPPPRSRPHASIDERTGTVTASVEVPCAPERVWRMLVTAELETWWGAPGVYRMRDWSSELRAGGTWRVLTVTADGRHLPASGEFLELDLPWKIVQTRRYEFDHPTLGRRDTTVTSLLEPRGRGTQLTVVHEGFDGMRQAAEEHAAGWIRVLGWLTTHARTVSGAEEVRR